jgi:hypothetical protein
MGFFEDPLPFSLFLALFLGVLPLTRFGDERRALGEYRFLLADILPILLGFMLEGVVFLFLTFLSGVLAERGRHDDWRGLVGVLFLLGVLLNYRQPSDCHVVFQPGRTPSEMDLHGSSGSGLVTSSLLYHYFFLVYFLE